MWLVVAWTLACRTQPYTPEPTPTGALTLSQDALDLGEVPVHSTAWQFLTLSNPGPGVLQLHEVRLGDDRLRPHWRVENGGPTAIQPGEDHEVGVVFTPQALGALDVSLEVLTDDPALPERRVALSGAAYGEAALRVEPPALSFGAVPLGQTVELDLQLSNLGNDDLHLEAITLEGAAEGAFALELNPQGNTLPPGYERGLVVVSFTPTTPGVAVDAIVIRSNDVESPSLAVVLTGTGEAP